MKAAILDSPNDLKIKQINKPKPAKNEILVKIKACGVCPTDVKKYTGVSPLPKFPFILGHEAAGIIEELGEDVSKDVYKPGDRVVFGNIITCGICRNCKNGKTTTLGVSSCVNHEIFGVTVDGGFREFASVPEKLIYKMPDNMAFNEATLVEPVACCLNAVEKAKIGVSEVVLIIGAGFMGLTQLELAKLKGARVAISDVIDERLEVAKSLGADIIINPKKEDLNSKISQFNDGQLADVVLCSVGGKIPFLQGLNALESGGRLVIVGGKYPPEKAEVDPNDIHYKQVEILGSVSYTPRGFVQIIQLIADKKISTEVLQSELLELEDLEQAFKDVLDTKGLRKCIIFD